MNKPWLFIFSVLLLSWSCQRPKYSLYEQLDSTLAEKYDNRNLSNYDTLLFLSDIGPCLTCNKLFFKIAQNLNHRQKTLFLVSADPLKIDISWFLKLGSQHIILDSKRHFETLNLLKSSGLIILKDGQVAEIIEINKENIGAAPKYFSGLNESNPLLPPL